MILTYSSVSRERDRLAFLPVATLQTERSGDSPRLLAAPNRPYVLVARRLFATHPLSVVSTRAEQATVISCLLGYFEMMEPICITRRPWRSDRSTDLRHPERKVLRRAIEVSSPCSRLRKHQLATLDAQIVQRSFSTISSLAGSLVRM